MESRLNLAAYRLVADTERLRRGFQRSSCDDVNNEACLCRGQIEPIPKKCLRVLAAHEGDPFDGTGGKMPRLKAVTHVPNARVPTPDLLLANLALVRGAAPIMPWGWQLHSTTSV